MMELREWFTYGGKLYGKIYNDTRGKFQDGESIITTKFKKDAGTFLEEGDVVKTKNSSYLLCNCTEQGLL